MILLWGILLGLMAGLVRSGRNGNPYQTPKIRGMSVVVVAFLPQFIAFFLPLTRAYTTYRTASFALVWSQLLLLLFVWLNRRTPAFWLMGTGLMMNFVVILVNGGLMPISLETIGQLAPEGTTELGEVGSRFGNSKDIILLVEDTRLEWLADRFVVPEWYPQRVAFSIGDVLIALGALWLFWAAGRGGDYEQTL